MQMIDVMKRLAELDSNNPNVVKAESKEQEFNGSNAVTGLNQYTGETVVTETLSVAELQKLSGLNESLAECGPMGMMGAGPMGMASARPTANFSLNASAATGDEVASMLTQIMNLAGVKDAGHHLGGHDALTGEPPMGSHHGADGMAPQSDIVKALSHIDGIEDEEAAMGADFSGQMDHEVDDKSPTPDVGDMADDVKDMADQLSKKEPADFGMGDAGVEEASRMFDNSPQERTTQYDPNSFADVINRLRDFDTKPYGSGDNPMKPHATEAVNTDETGSLAEQLMAEYQAFTIEGNQQVDEVGDTAKGQKMLSKVKDRAKDRAWHDPKSAGDRKFATKQLKAYVGADSRLKK